MFPQQIFIWEHFKSEKWMIRWKCVKIGQAIFRLEFKIFFLNLPCISVIVFVCKIIWNFNINFNCPLPRWSLVRWQQYHQRDWWQCSFCESWTWAIVSSISLSIPALNPNWPLKNKLCAPPPSLSAHQVRYWLLTKDVQ